MHNLSSTEVFERSSLLLGADNIEKLQKAKVAVIGLGGVGSFVAEALARSGLGHLFLIDKDVYQASNLNRQLGADCQSINCSKVKVSCARIKEIAPFCQVEGKEEFITPVTNLSYLDDCDFVADCIDTVSSKIALVLYCQSKNIALISAMGTARKFDPAQITVCDLFQTKYDRICRVMRRELRQRQVKHLTVCYSPEPLKEQTAEISRLKLQQPGAKVPLASLIFVPGTAGLRIAHHIISRLIN